MKTIDFPTHPTLNATGQWNKLRKNGDTWELYNTTSKQSKPLVGKSLALALQVVVEPLMA